MNLQYLGGFARLFTNFSVGVSANSHGNAVQLLILCSLAGLPVKRVAPVVDHVLHETLPEVDHISG